MSDPNTIREAVKSYGRYHKQEMYGCMSCYRGEYCRDKVIHDAALAYADILEVINRDAPLR